MARKTTPKKTATKTNATRRTSSKKTREQAAVPANPDRPRKRKRKVSGFHIPPTLRAAEKARLQDLELTGNAFEALINSRPMVVSDDVPVGHLWKIGWTDGPNVNVCYKTQAGGCHWKLVPQSNIPDWDPDGPQ